MRWNAVAEELVLLWPVDGVVLAFEVIHREAPCDRHLASLVTARKGVWLVGLLLRLGADDVLDAGERKQIAELGRVEEGLSGQSD